MLLGAIRAIHKQSKGTYGWPRIHAELRHRGVHVSRKRVARLMRAAGLSGMVRRRKGKTTIRVPGIATAPDLVRRDFAPTEPNRLWVADLTEIATWEGKLYLAVVVDCFSRRCVGWAMAEHMRAELVVEALEMALWQRRPDIGLIHHSDRGGQYVSLIFGQTARAAGIDVSMGAKGCALDNAVCESFFATLKKELTRRCSWPTRRQLETAVFAWIEGWYNRRRLHSTLGYLSPAEYENRTLGQRCAGLAASRLAHTSEMIKEKAAQTSPNMSTGPGQVQSEPGFGPLTAAKLVGEIAGAGRFASDAKLARAAGVAPIPVSSGKTNRHRLDRGGNRQINATIHRIAVTRLRCHPETQDYIARNAPKARAPKKPSAASSATSPDASGTCSRPAAPPRVSRSHHQSLDIGAAKATRRATSR